MQPSYLPSALLKIIQGSSSRQQLIVTYYTTWLKVKPRIGGFCLPQTSSLSSKVCRVEIDVVTKGVRDGESASLLIIAFFASLCLRLTEEAEGQGARGRQEDLIHKFRRLNGDEGKFPRSTNQFGSLKADCRKAGNFVDIDDSLSPPCSLPPTPLRDSVSLQSSKLDWWSNIRLSFLLERRLCQG
jgi:hypothetical protein